MPVLPTQCQAVGLSLQGWWQSPAGVWRGATRGLPGWGALPRHRAVQQPAAGGGFAASIRGEQCLLVVLGHEANMPVMNWEITEWGEVMKMRTSSFCLLRRKEELMVEQCQGDEVLQIREPNIHYWNILNVSEWNIKGFVKAREEDRVSFLSSVPGRSLSENLKYFLGFGFFFLLKQNLLHWSGVTGSFCLHRNPVTGHMQN